MNAEGFVQLGLAAGSIVLAELVRDAYHVAGHYWEPLQRSHNLHHKVYRRDLTISSLDLYYKAQLANDAPEAAVMASVVALTATLTGQWGMWLGCIYSLGFLATALARSRGWLMETDLTHKAGDLDTNPSVWTVNRTYHWRHHFDSGNAYYCGYFTIADKLMGTALSLKGKTIAITGASGSMGRALIATLQRRGAKIIALTSREGAEFDPQVRVVAWRTGDEAALRSTLDKVDILIINHGINQGDRSPEAIGRALEINTLSAWRLMELFFETVTKSEHRALKEVWVNTSEAEVNPAFSPMYELSKRAIGDLITLRRLDAPCVVRKLILGPFKSDLNPIGIMSAGWVARAIVALAERDIRNIIVTINPLTYLLFPIKELAKSLYFRAFAKADSTATGQATPARTPHK